MTQPSLFPDDDPAIIIDLTTGIMYLAFGENAVFKFGISETRRTKARRITNHTKYVTSLREVWSQLIPHYRKQETALRRTLETYALDRRIPGTQEWWRLDAYTADLLLTFVAGLGADQAAIDHIRREAARIIANHAQHPAHWAH